MGDKEAPPADFVPTPAPNCVYAHPTMRVYRGSALSVLGDATGFLARDMEDKSKLPRTVAFLQQVREALRTELAQCWCNAQHARTAREQVFGGVLGECKLDNTDAYKLPPLEDAGELCEVPLENLLALSVLLKEVFERGPPHTYSKDAPTARVFRGAANPVPVRNLHEFAAVLNGASLVTGERDLRMDTVFVSLDAASAVALQLLLPAMQPSRAQATPELGEPRAHLRAERCCVGYSWASAVPAMCAQMAELQQRVEIAAYAPWH